MCTSFITYSTRQQPINRYKSQRLFSELFSSKHKTSAGARGPPRESFQRTPHGNFDISHKRLCKVATPQEDLYAVNLRSLKEIQHELESVHTMVKALNATFEKL